MAEKWPRVIMRGPLRGREFASQTEYDEARALVDATESPDTAPGGDAGGPPIARRGRPAKGKVTKEMVTAIIFPLNIGLYMVPATRLDALNDDEIDKLSDAIVRVAAVNKYVERAILAGVTSSAYVELAIVVGAISIKRAANHGLLPHSVGASVGAMMGLGAMPEPPPVEQNGHVEYAESPLGVPIA